MLHSMSWPVIFRRQEAWLPTVWGWLLFLIVGACALTLTCRQAYFFLAPNHSSGSRLLVVEGWMPPDELDQAVERFRVGGYDRIVTTGGPIQIGPGWPEHGSYAEWTRDYLVRRGIPGNSVISVPAPASAQERTFLSAVMVREWLKNSGLPVDALDLFSSGVHSRRSWTLYRLAMGPRTRIGIFAAKPAMYDPDAWWSTSVGAKTVISEALGWIWTACFFRPGAPGSHEEKWGDPRKAPHSDTRTIPDSARGAGIQVRQGFADTPMTSGNGRGYPATASLLQVARLDGSRQSGIKQ